ncbi:peptidoglycan DD-metalloendopeptidase family protein [Streptomyces sp. NPDC048751]|uniref:M23 family metallopeptidase n=1 Tax=Streptomyces sp. NPDC048751 TaxID=3365591 RepID=UPI0037220534
MRSLRRHPRLFAVLVCAVAVLAARPTTSDDDLGDGPDAGLSVQVARLYADAAAATQRYEEVRRAADVQAAEVSRLGQLLDRERQEIAVHHEELGRIARAQYRDSGGLPLAAQIVFAGNPEELMRGQQVFSRRNVAVANAIGKGRRAEARLTADEARAATAWQALERRRAELDGIKKNIEEKLEEARWQLQGQANASVAAGSCRGAVRLDQPQTRFTSAWVAPVEGYQLSAGFGSGGAHWARRHTGQDFAVPIGTPVRAVGEGRVVSVSCGGAFGIEVVLEHDGGYYTQYAHLAAVTVDQGDRVATGQWIGQSGTTGNSTGPHLHFEVRVTPQLGSSVDPVPWLAERGVHVG